MTKEEILDYVMNTPDNTNRMVLSDMLDSFSSGGGNIAPLITTFVDEPTEGDYQIDKTFGELLEAFENGTPCILQDGSGESQKSLYLLYTISWYYSNYSYRYSGSVTFGSYQLSCESSANASYEDFLAIRPNGQS